MIKKKQYCENKTIYVWFHPNLLKTIVTQESNQVRNGIFLSGLGQGVEAWADTSYLFNITHLLAKPQQKTKQQTK